MLQLVAVKMDQPKHLDNSWGQELSEISANPVKWSSRITSNFDEGVDQRGAFASIHQISGGTCFLSLLNDSTCTFTKTLLIPDRSIPQGFTGIVVKFALWPFIPGLITEDKLLCLLRVISLDIVDIRPAYYFRWSLCFFFHF